jgi:hypothetical protein
MNLQRLAIPVRRIGARGTRPGWRPRSTMTSAKHRAAGSIEHPGKGFMRFIDIREDDHGFLLDPTRYLDRLERFKDRLPPGAAALATDPGHYTFGDRCLKSLVLESASLDPRDGGTGAQLAFRAFAGSSEPVLVIRYAGVTDFSVKRDPATEGNMEVLLDEILPTESGCTHEIQSTIGSVLISCSDLDAEWRVERSS